MGRLRRNKLLCFVTAGILIFAARPGYAQYTQIFDHYFEKAKEAISQGDYPSALLYLETAQAVSPEHPALLPYFNIVKRALEDRVRGNEQANIQPLEEKKDLPEIIPSPVAASSPKEKMIENADKVAPQRTVPASKASEPFSILAPKTVSRETSKTSAAISKVPPAESKSVLEVPRVVSADKKGTIRNVVELDEEMWGLQPDTEIELSMNQELVLKGNNIERFLVIAPDVIEAKRIGNREVLIIPRRFGRSFLHIWDSGKRWTFNIVTVFESQVQERKQEQASRSARYVDPFRFGYDASWNSFNRGPSWNKLDRQSLNVRNQFTVVGPTPYGDFDAYTILNKSDTVSTEATDYSVGLSNAKTENFKDINIRLFDANKYISDLTFPGRDFRGFLVEGTTMDDQFSLVSLRGKDQTSFGIVSPDLSTSRESYVEAGKLSYRPTDDQALSLNYARAWGEDKSPSASSNVVSGQYEKEDDYWNMSSEVGYDEEDLAQIAWARFDLADEKELFIKARNVPSDYATALGPTGNQGEVGTEMSFHHKWDETDLNYYLDLYRDRDNENPEDPDAVNLDFNANFNRPLNDKDSLRGNLYFIHTPGLLADRTDFRISETLSHRFDFLWIPNAQLSWTPSYQRNRSDSSPSSDYNRTGFATNFALPVTRHLNYNAGYESYYVDDVAEDEEAYPSVFTTGLTYHKALSDRLNMGLSTYYRDEQTTEDLKSFMAGQDSLSLGTNLTYQPRTGMQFYVDGNIRDVWAENDRSDAYMEADIRLGLHSEWDLGYRWNPQGIIQGFVFKDLDGNGEKSDHEIGIPGVRVKVGEQDVVTDKEGWYFANVQASSVVVSLDVNTIPQGYVFQDITARTFDIQHNHYYRGNFALTTESGIYGVVYFDENGNGRPDNGDEFLYKVKITLDGTESALTDSKGAYFFYNIPEGAHIITLDLNSLPMSYLPQVPLKNEVVITEGATYIFHVPVKRKSPSD